MPRGISHFAKCWEYKSKQIHIRVPFLKNLQSNKNINEMITQINVVTTNTGLTPGTVTYAEIWRVGRT